MRMLCEVAAVGAFGYLAWVTWPGVVFTGLWVGSAVVCAIGVVSLLERAFTFVGK